MVSVVVTVCSWMSMGPCEPCELCEALTILPFRPSSAITVQAQRRTMSPTVLVAALYLVPGSFTSPDTSTRVSTAATSKSMAWRMDSALLREALEMPVVDSRTKPAYGLARREGGAGGRSRRARHGAVVVKRLHAQAEALQVVLFGVCDPGDVGSHNVAAGDSSAGTYR